MDGLHKKNREYWNKEFSILPKSHQPDIPNELIEDMREKMTELRISMHKLGQKIANEKIIPGVDPSLIFNSIRNILNGGQKHISYTVVAMATALDIDITDYKDGFSEYTRTR